MMMLLVLTPFTYSGGGGPVGNRYFLSFYPLFLLLTPALAGVRGAAVALAIGALFTAKILFNPFYSSFHPGEHLKSGAQRWLPLELTLLLDLPMAADRDRSNRRLGGTPPVLAYFPDDNAYNPEGDMFWVKGKSRAEIILRAPVVDAGSGQFVTKAIRRLRVEIHNGALPNRVTVSTGRESRTLEMKADEEVASCSSRSRTACPTIASSSRRASCTPSRSRPAAGSCRFSITPGSSDSRFLGARVLLVPEYFDAEVSTWVPRSGEN